MSRRLPVMMAVFAVLISSCGTSGSSTEAIGQLEWSIDVTEGDDFTWHVVLKGDLPNGYPTETWTNGELLDRDEEGDFSWDISAGLPMPVSIIEDMDDCAAVEAEFNFWLGQAATALEEDVPTDSTMRNLAFAEVTVARMSVLGC